MSNRPTTRVQEPLAADTSMMPARSRHHPSSAKHMGRETLHLAARCLEDLAKSLNDDFDRIVNDVLTCQGNLFVSGVGKSRLVAEKIAATLSSCGTCAMPLCALDALHGDIARVRSNDFLLALSSSGETAELLQVMAIIKPLGVPVAAITRSRSSQLGQLAQYTLEIGAHPEAGPFAVLPTTSTTAMLTLGDALAMALAERRGFSLAELARVHPHGSIGQKLLKDGSPVQAGVALNI